VRILAVKNFIKGLITSIEDYSIPDGAASDSKNWVNRGDRIELRKGYKVLGTEQTGTGKIDGLHVAFKADGTQVLFRKRGRKLEYYNTAASDWAETGTNMFPAAAEADEASFANYASLAGNQMFVTTPNSGPFKIMVANPGSYTDLTYSSKNFQGYIKIKQNRMFLWNRKKDRTGIYGSYIDTGTNTQVSGEAIGTGNGAQTVFTGTLAFKGGGAVRTCFGVVIKQAGTESLTDDYNGTLVGVTAPTTGTINYTTGEYTITFGTPPPNLQAITADYQWENSNNQGVTDFTKSAPRTAGQGFVFRQDDGGGQTQNVCSYGDTEYCLHRQKSWALTLTATDTNATNLIFRDKVGIPNWRGAVETGDGVYFVDDFDQTDPKFRLLTLDKLATQVIPLPISDALNLEDYRFDKAVTYEYGELILWGCRHKDSAENDTTFVYNKRLKLFEKHDYSISCLATYNGALVAGDSITDNVYELFSGFDDNGSTIGNCWEGNLSKLQMEQLKKVRRFWVQGEISRDQTLKIYLSFDRAPFVLVGTQSGTDRNVDAGGRTVIGSDAIGQSTLGGQTSVSVYNYIKEMKLVQGKFSEVKMRIEATGIGYVSMSGYTFHDIILYETKLPTRYRAAA
jgi:hypothetical protein